MKCQLALIIKRQFHKLKKYFRHGGSIHESYGSCRKTEGFCTVHSNICTSLVIRQFSDELQSMVTHRNMGKLRPLTTATANRMRRTARESWTCYSLQLVCTAHYLEAVNYQL